MPLLEAASRLQYLRLLEVASRAAEDVAELLRPLSSAM